MAFEKGNRIAANRREWQNAIKRALSRAAGTVATGLDQIADKLVAAAIAGDPDAREEIANRLDGKPTQAIEQTIQLTDARLLSDGVLADIAVNSGAGASSSEGDSSELH